MPAEVLPSNGFLLSAPLVCAAALLSSLVYGRGWRTLRRKGVAARGRFTAFRMAAFFGGWSALLLALASPLDAVAERLLSAHMVQHILLTMVAPPLFWLSLPAMPMLFGVGTAARTAILAPLLSAPVVRLMLRALGHPLVGFSTIALATIAWHMPSAYTLALRDPWWHQAEHACMFVAGMLFWLCVIAPFPYANRWPRIAMVPYLVAADLVNTAVSAYLAFSSVPVYAWYANIGPAYGTDPLLDQQLAAGLMWVPGSVLYLGGAILITISYLFPHRVHPRARRIPLTVLPKRPPSHEGDLLQTPLVGRALRSSGARLTLRCVLLALVLCIVLDGLLGSQDAPMNLAGTVPWTHWRGVAIVAILAVGNVACMACPLLAPRSLLRKWFTPTRALPRALRSKWIAVALVVAWLVAYEAFDLWSSPLAIAMIVLGFIVVATAVDMCFAGASFCRSLCPIGQYQMLLGTVSARSVRAIDAAVCARCVTHDCLKGRRGQGGEFRPGCGLDLFIPKKIGNLDCTFCLDCVSACPHQNVGVLPVLPCAELANAGWRSQVGTLAARVDVAALALVFTFGAAVNAAGMTAPVLRVLEASAGVIGAGGTLAQACFVVGGIACGFGLSSAAAGMSSVGSFRERFARLSFAFLPLGAAIWFAHFVFHLVTGFATAEVAGLRVLHDLGWVSASPDRVMSCCAPAPAWLMPVELLTLSLGVSGALGVYWWSIVEMRAREALARSFSSVLYGWIPGAVCILLVWAVAAWIMFQPMEMRGTFGFE